MLLANNKGKQSKENHTFGCVKNNSRIRAFSPAPAARVACTNPYATNPY